LKKRQKGSPHYQKQRKRRGKRKKKEEKVFALNHAKGKGISTISEAQGEGGEKGWDRDKRTTEGGGPENPKDNKGRNESKQPPYKKGGKPEGA